MPIGPPPSRAISWTTSPSGVAMTRRSSSTAASRSPSGESAPAATIPSGSQIVTAPLPSSTMWTFCCRNKASRRPSSEIHSVSAPGARSSSDGGSTKRTDPVSTSTAWTAIVAPSRKRISFPSGCQMASSAERSAGSSMSRRMNGGTASTIATCRSPARNAIREPSGSQSRCHRCGSASTTLTGGPSPWLIHSVLSPCALSWTWKARRVPSGDGMRYWTCPTPVTEIRDCGLSRSRVRIWLVVAKTTVPSGLITVGFGSNPRPSASIEATSPATRSAATSRSVMRRSRDDHRPSASRDATSRAACSIGGASASIRRPSSAR